MKLMWGQMDGEGTVGQWRHDSAKTVVRDNSFSLFGR